MPYKVFDKLLASIFLTLTGVELVSWIAFNSPMFHQIVFCSILLVIFILSIYRLEYGIYAVFAELVIGSQGHLLQPQLFGATVPLRYGLFAVVMLAWIIAVLRQRRVVFFQVAYWRWLVVLFVFFVLGAITAYFHGIPMKQIFLDANGYLFFGLVFPVTQAIHNKTQIRILLHIVLAGIGVLALQTILILFIYSHFSTFYYYIPSIYRWIRDLRLGEITRYDNGFSRVFFQSHIYIIFGLFITLACQIFTKQRRYAVFSGLALLLLFLSYSRSFWVATAITSVLFTIYLIMKQKIRWRSLIGLYGTTGACFAIGIVVTLGIINMPIGSDQGTDLSAQTLLNDRTEDVGSEPAAQSRMALLKPLLQQNLHYPVLGEGFGSTVTYYSEDARIKNEQNPTGEYTTFSFEWGYLDLWLKLGLGGVIVYLIFIMTSLRRGYRLSLITLNPDDKYMVVGAMFATVALVFTHGITPYLNHPLGIGWLIIFVRIVDIYETTR